MYSLRSDFYEIPDKLIDGWPAALEALCVTLEIACIKPLASVSVTQGMVRRRGCTLEVAVSFRPTGKHILAVSAILPRGSRSVPADVAALLDEVGAALEHAGAKRITSLAEYLTQERAAMRSKRG